MFIIHVNFDISIIHFWYVYYTYKFWYIHLILEINSWSFRCKEYYSIHTDINLIITFTNFLDFLFNIPAQRVATSRDFDPWLIGLTQIIIFEKHQTILYFIPLAHESECSRRHHGLWHIKITLIALIIFDQIFKTSFQLLLR